MVDTRTPSQRRKIMQAVKGKDTGPEWAVSRLLHRLGYRYRLHDRSLPGTPDIVFPGRKAAVFVHGCFWHGHGCSIGQPPKSRVAYWQEKIDANRQRDARNRDRLEADGWRVLTVWQCELKASDDLKTRLARFLGPRRLGTP